MRTNTPERPVPKTPKPHPIHRHCVYALVDGLSIMYVGYSARLEQRQRQHRTNHPNERMIVLGRYATIDDGLEQERRWIAGMHRMGHPLRNKQDGGSHGTLHRSVSSLTRARLSEAIRKRYRDDPTYRAKTVERWKDPDFRTKMSKIMTGTRRTPETRAKMSRAGFLGRRHSPTARAKMSKTQKERWADPSYRALMSKPGSGRVASPEAREQMARVATERWKDPAFRARMAAANKGRVVSPAGRANMSKAAIKRLEDPAFRARMAAGLHRKPHTAEAKAKMSAARRGRHVSLETRSKMSATHKERYKTDPSARARRSRAATVGWSKRRRTLAELPRP